MSAVSDVVTEICDLLELRRTLKEMQLKVEEVRVDDGTGKSETVELTVTGAHGTIGFRRNSAGSYEVCPGTGKLSPEQSKARQSFINSIKRKYAYNKVVKELQKQGYVIAQEEKKADNTIRLVARKWGK